jgi:ABC-type bacteriocin/lantibiotic exporter with double-glycine peptidase domain
MLGLYAIALFRLIPSANRILNSVSMIRFHSSSIDLLLKEINSIENNQNINSNFTKYKNFLFQEKIILENINFKYSSSDRTILKDINLQIKKNEVIGISGNSGSGKSTLLNIICSLLKPTSGLITVDKIPIEDIYKYYQSKIGYVSQKIYLMDDTFIQNITFGSNKLNYDHELFNNIIKKTNLEDVLKNLPLKENTIIGERGLKLSGGQQQRMGFARALYKRPEILILDEATNALDDNSEKEILDMIKNLRDKLTIVIVSHKKLVLDYCDKVYELKDGVLRLQK